MTVTGMRWWAAPAACLLMLGAAGAAAIDDWRQRAVAVRRLADNDAMAAYTQAQRLQKSILPAGV